MTFTENKYLIEMWNWLINVITIESFAKIAILYFFIIWISLIVWVIRDAGNRSDSVFLQLFALIIVLFGTPLGIFIYLLIRPTKTLFEKYYDEIESNLDYLTESIKKKFNEKEKDGLSCYKCNYPIDQGFNFCPNCNTELKHSCRFCGKKIDKSWQNCAHCGKDSPYKDLKKSKEEKKKK